MSDTQDSQKNKGVSTITPGVFTEVARPTSAPPIQGLGQQTAPTLDDNAEAFRSDPAYVKWYYSQNPRDPRVPPPIIKWNNNNAQRNKSKEEGDAPLLAPTPYLAPVATTAIQGRPGLVQMIQDDFPRTPSPVFANEAGPSFVSVIPGAMEGKDQQHQYYELQQVSQQMGYQNPQQVFQSRVPMTSSVPISMIPPQVNYGTVVSQQIPGIQSIGLQGIPGMQALPTMHLVSGIQGLQPQLVSTLPQSMTVGIPPGQYYTSNYTPQMLQSYGMLPMYAPTQTYDNAYQINFDQAPYAATATMAPIVPSSNVPEKKKGPRRERGHDDGPRTRLMEEFRNMKAKRWELQDLTGHIVEFSRDQDGSRLIQRKLEGPSCTDAEKDLVFGEVYKEALGLMTDVFGNYVIQKLFEHGLPHHRKLLAGVLKGNVLSMTLQTYGCRVIQKALEVIDEEDQIMVASELDGHVLRCVLDQNGNHVIQKCIERIPPQNVAFIVQSFVGNVQNLAVHAYGCRVIQRILEYCEDHQEFISPILDEILDSVHTLARDQYGNYVLQHVLINGKPLYQCAIVERLRGDILELAQHKFASNVVEKMFQHGSHEERNLLLNDMVKVNPDGTSALHIMMKDQYANYVVQKIIDLADEAQRRQIIDHIKPHIATLRRYTYGKHIIARIEKIHTNNKGHTLTTT